MYDNPEEAYKTVNNINPDVYNDELLNNATHMREQAPKFEAMGPADRHI